MLAHEIDFFLASTLTTKSIVMFFKKGLRYPSLICKLVMKNTKMSDVMFTIANQYALAMEATLDTREQKKENESGHMD
jgi:hypothetical protein